MARTYAIVGWVAALVGAVGAIALRIVDPVPVIPDALGFGDLALVGFEFLGVTFASVGALLVVRRPENTVGWFMLLIGAGNALAGLSAAVTFSAVAGGPAGAATAGFAGWLTGLFTMIGGLVIGLGFIFRTGRGAHPRLGSVHPDRRGHPTGWRPTSSAWWTGHSTRRKPAYGLVCVGLLVVFGVNLALQSAIRGITRNDPLVLAASTLSVAVLFNPLRSRVQSIVDGRFNRARHDAERTVAGFAGRLRNQLNLSNLAGELERTSTEAVEPTRSAVWLRKDAVR